MLFTKSLHESAADVDDGPVRAVTLLHKHLRCCCLSPPPVDLRMYDGDEEEELLSG